ncbi:hypothetical protein N6H13_25880 [Paenibacillus sp. CC-CFT742]|nr:hypothetical protein [Paenibacillus sp. CC-CFT742]WJH28425.1 hypothetical protein N6H13_25880 [Paenibacillus sp. CC-CFT742]
MIWWWAMDWAPDGNISNFEPIDLADAAHFEGDPEVFFNALVEANYIGKTLDGYEVLNWHNIGGQVLESRKKAAAKKAKQREMAAAKKAAEAAGKTDVPGDIPRDIPGTDEGRPPPVPVYKELDIDLDKEKELIKKDIPQDENQQQNQNQDQNPKSEPNAENPAEPKDPGQKPGKSGKGKTGKKGSRKKPEYEENSPFLKMANYLKEKIDGFAQAEGIAHLTKRSNMQTWADDFRLLVEVDGQHDRNLIRDVMEWLPTSVFWRKNVLSGSKFREKFGTLVLEMRSDKAKGKKGSGGGGGKGHKTEIPIVQHNTNLDSGPTDEEFEEMLRNAAATQAAKAGER